jgi:hypothetical protein
MAVQDDGHSGVIGATKKLGLSPEEAFREIGREVISNFCHIRVASSMSLCRLDALKSLVRLCPCTLVGWVKAAFYYVPVARSS